MVFDCILPDPALNTPLLLIFFCFKTVIFLIIIKKSK